MTSSRSRRDETTACTAWTSPLRRELFFLQTILETGISPRWIRRAAPPRLLRARRNITVLRWFAIPARSVVFVSNTGGNHIWKTDADGTNVVQLTHGIGEVYPVCPKEGRWVAFVSEDEALAGGNLRKMSLDGGQDSALIPNTVIGINLAPDGKHILYAFVDAGAGNKFRVGQATLDGSGPITFIEPPPTLTMLRNGHWIPGQQALAYVDVRFGTPNLWTFSLTGKPAQQLTHFVSGRIFAFALSPDGSKLALSRGAITSDAVLFSRNR